MPRKRRKSVFVGSGRVGQGFSYVSPFYSRPYITRVLIIFFCLQQWKSPAHLGHLFVFNGLRWPSLRAPFHHFARSLDAIFDVSIPIPTPLPTPHLFHPCFAPREHDKS